MRKGREWCWCLRAKERAPSSSNPHSRSTTTMKISPGTSSWKIAKNYFLLAPPPTPSHKMTPTPTSLSNPTKKAALAMLHIKSCPKLTSSAMYSCRSPFTNYEKRRGWDNNKWFIFFISRFGSLNFDDLSMIGELWRQVPLIILNIKNSFSIWVGWEWLGRWFDALFDWNWK